MRDTDTPDFDVIDAETDDDDVTLSPARHRTIAERGPSLATLLDILRLLDGAHDAPGGLTVVLRDDLEFDTDEVPFAIDQASLPPTRCAKDEAPVACDRASLARRRDPVRTGCTSRRLRRTR